MLNHPEASGASGASDAAEPTSSATVLQAAALGAGVPVGASTTANDVPAPGQRQIHASVTVIQPNYTVAAGDTLVKIADKFNTTADRIQAFNNLSDPRALRVGTKLVIPPPF
jgi:LysM repeat protein